MRNVGWELAGHFALTTPLGLELMIQRRAQKRITSGRETSTPVSRISSASGETMPAGATVNLAVWLSPGGIISPSSSSTCLGL